MTVAQTEQLGALRKAGKAKPRGLWWDAWRRLRRNKAALIGAAYVLFMMLVAIFAPVIAPKSPYDSSTLASYTPPFWEAGSNPNYILGTDGNSRDELSRLIYGARISMVVGFVPVAITTVIGASIGMISGWLGGRWDNLLMRFVDVVYAFPTLLFFIIVSAALRDTFLGRALGGLLILFGAFAIVGWTDMSRLVRGQVLSVKEKEYIEAARAVGVPTSRILLRHVLPNTLAPIIVSISFGVPGYILAEASLSYIGLGIWPPTASWGSMVNDAFDVVTYKPFFVIAPAALIALVMIAFTFVGDGLRDALDPQMSK